jgi:Zn-dependent protease with chaperone function
MKNTWNNTWNGDRAARAGPIGRRRWPGAGPLVVALSLLLAAVVWAADGRTVLEPGWNMFSPRQDVEIGQQVSLDAERQLPMLDDSRVDRYVSDLGRQLSAQAPGEEYPYTFKVVNDRAINALALPGGPVFINRGVIEAADNEAQLAGVIAHEISHVALRHGTNQASKASAAQVPLAILGGIIGSDSTQTVLAQLGASFAVNSVLLKYSRTAETQADVMGTQILYDSEYDPRAMVQFFETLEAQQRGGGPVEFFSNHPSPENRVERVNEEVDALGGVRRNSTTNSRDFDEIKRYVRSLPAPSGQQLSADRRNGTSELRIVSARYGADNRFIDVRERMQSRVNDDRLDLRVTNSTMGGDPISQSKTLQMTYEWAGRVYDVTVQENQQLLIPTDRQVRETRDAAGTTIDRPSDRSASVDNSLLRISYPDNWRSHGQGDAMTITPEGGLVDDRDGNQALAYGVIVNIFEPRDDRRFDRQLQGPGQARRSGEEFVTRLERSTDELVQELRLSNRNMRVIRYREDIHVDGDLALSTYLSNDSPVGGRETDWLVTLERPDGVLFLVFTAPERDFQGYEGVFHEMLRSVRLKR